MSDQTKNNIAWTAIFAKHGILEELQHEELIKIKSTWINVYRESRLMTKFDNRSQLPKIFGDNQLGLLPISRGEYVLGRFNIFHELEPLTCSTFDINFQNTYESLDFDNISSESAAIGCAYISGILEDFVGEEIIQTISGRMGSNVFDFNIKDRSDKPLRIQVNKAQLEIDAGFESQTSLILLEAKNFISDDFIIRQLYYPLRLWSENVTKRVRTVYLTYTNGIFELREYEFLDIHTYSSIRLIKSRKYSISHTNINIQTLQSILGNIAVTPEPINIPFPQADSFERVINLCEILSNNGTLTKTYLTENYGFDARQTDYYINAGRYLGLVDFTNEDGHPAACLSSIGKVVFNKPLGVRTLKLIEILLTKKVFNSVLKLYIDNAEMPRRNDIVNIMKASELYNINSEETFSRRASTVIGWINWLLSQIDE